MYSQEESSRLQYKEEDLLLGMQDDHTGDELCRNSLEEHIDNQDPRCDRQKTTRSIQLLSVYAYTQSASLR